ncbi:WLM domain-containing protein [Apiospora phragmitis]|uniref:WLM domain-containing protein n=1 Tax=Apiospora phragmitis TaxID=2905665 RepID=A0ABR1UQY7_9PEZI
MPEVDPLILSFSHLAKLPRASEALLSLKKIASLVKPIMRNRRWKVKTLAEFYPNQQNLLGLNEGRGYKICLRLRYPGDQNQFLPFEQVLDTMLHELAHNVHGPHDGKFHALWDQLRDEHESLAMKGYTGEGFLSNGQRLGGRNVPMQEARHMARAAAEKRRVLSSGSGRRLGGRAVGPGQDIRRVIADVAERRTKTLKGCASGTLKDDEVREIAATATNNGFRTQAEEDAANDAAIAQALWELVQEDEKAKYGASYVPPSAENPTGNGEGTVLSDGNKQATTSQQPKIQARPAVPSYFTPEPTSWDCEICTLENPLNYLCCDACGTERPEKVARGLAERTNKRQRTTIDLT